MVEGRFPFSSPWLSLALIIVIGLLAFSNNYQGQFIYDDIDTIVDNSAIKTFSPIWSPLWITHMTPISGRPVVALTFALNYAVGGLDVFGYHLVNNIIHLLAGLALFGIIRATLLLPRFAPQTMYRANCFALAVSLLWLIHPLQTEAVDYISQRTEILAGLFYLLTILFSIKALTYVAPRRWQVAALVVCALGMGSKEIMVSAPLMVLCYDRLLVTGSFREAWQRRRGFYACLAATCLIVVLLQLNAPRGSAVRFDGFGELNVSPFDYLRTQLGVVVHYLRLAFWPHPLSLSYQDLPFLREFSSSLVLPTTILASLAGLTIWGFYRGRWWSLLGLWFFAIILPSSSIIPMPYEIATERRMYLPLISLIILTVSTVESLWSRVCAGVFPGRRSWSYGPVAILVVIVTVMGVTTWKRNEVYRTEVGIWQATVNVRPRDLVALVSLGDALVGEGRVVEAIGPYQEAARLKPDDAEIFSRLGASFGQAGRFEEAVAMHRKALALEPDSAIYHYHLGITFLRMQDLDNAALFFHKALDLDPNFFPAHGNLGLMLMKNGDYAGAAEHVEKLYALRPGDLDSCRLLGALRVAQNRWQEAIRLYREALTIAPGDPDITQRLSVLTVNGSH